MKTVPEVAEKIESGALNLSQLTQVQKWLKEEKKKGQTVATEKVQEILNTLENKSSFESEKILAIEFNQPIKAHESAVEFVDPLTGRKCISRHQLEIDHRQPLALGGTHEELNMRILCRNHNSYEAQRWGVRRPSDEELAQVTPF